MNSHVFQWAVIGAGPAGIAAVGKLLDANQNPNDILWLDPAFQVGDLGQFWQNVSSNTRVELFSRFLQDAQSFSYPKAPFTFQLNELPPEDTCTLQHIVEPLQWVTHHLTQVVRTQKTMAHHLQLTKRSWLIQSDTMSYHAKRVILATGSVPEQLPHTTIDTLPFHVAIDKTRLASAVDVNETYAVFGSSHSAVMIMHHLVNQGVKKIINFYRSPCRYALNMGDWILFDNTGLKGQTAEWAKQHLDGVLPSNLTRHLGHDEQIKQHLPHCDKAIYAVGFKRRDSIQIDGIDLAQYNPHVGIIAPGLFGFGIAYPQKKADPFGQVESQVGLWKFMVYLNHVLPIWFKYYA